MGVPVLAECSNVQYMPTSKKTLFNMMRIPVLQAFYSSVFAFVQLGALKALLRRGALPFAVAALLAACGGGGGGDNPPAAQSVSPPPASGGTATLSITSFSPASAAVGGVVTVTGTALNIATAAKVGNVSAALVVNSATQAQVTVPSGATSGKIELSGSGQTALSTTDLQITATPTVSLIAPASVIAGNDVTLTGTNLDVVTSATLNGVTLTRGTQSATSLVLTIPSNATSGFIQLNGVAISQQLTVVGALRITSLSPTTVVVGNTLTINGSNLNRAVSVTFANNSATANVATATASAATVVVPAAAQSGVVRVNGNMNDNVTSSTSITVVPRIVVDASKTYAVNAAGESVTITGQGLTQVSSVVVGGVNASITSQTLTQLTFAAPAGVTCASITLNSSTQPSVAAGTLDVANACANSPVRIADIEYAQVLSQNPTETRQRLVPGKKTWVRAYVVSSTAGRSSPTVRLSASINGQALGQVQMTGPAMLPQLAAGAALPGTLRYDETQTFNAELPANWVNANLQVKVEVDPGNANGVFSSRDSAPNVGSNTRIDLVLVPLVSGPNVPQMPTADDVVNEIVRSIPVQRSDVTVTIRAAYNLTSVTTGVLSSSEFGSALQELESLREQEAPTKQYYGFVKPMATSGTAGIGYVNSVQSNDPALSSLGWDASRTNWRRTMIHEFGHNYSRSHAPCGGVASSDANYPYADGDMGPQPLFNSNTNDIIAPTTSPNNKDIMGYCSGIWFSDYNYRFVQQFLEYQRSRTGNLVQTQMAASATDLITLQGVVTADGVTLRPVRASRGVPRASDGGDYTLRLVLRDGRTVEQRFTTLEVDHDEGRHFSVVLPNPGAIASVSVLHKGAPLPVILPLAGGALKQANAVSPDAPVDTAPTVTWSERGASLQLQWDSARYPHAAVTFVRGAERRVLGLQLTGGQARVNTVGLPAGGEFELSLSDGLNAQVISLKR
jgi:hypothetical protein